MTANLDLSTTYSRVVAGCIFGKRKRRGARDTEGVFSADGGGDRHVCVVSTEDNVTVGLNAVTVGDSRALNSPTMRAHSTVCTCRDLVTPVIAAKCHRFVMAALRNRCGHYIFALWFLSSVYLFFFPRLISAAADWMSTILTHMVWP